MIRPALLLLLVGCDDPASWLADEPERAPIPTPRIEGAVATAIVTTAPIPRPTLWEDGLPAMPTELGPMLGTVLAGICHDAPGAREAALAVLGADSAWPSWLQLCEAPEYCSWALAEAAREGAPRTSLLLAATGCSGPEAEAAFLADDTPDEAVAIWFAEQAWQGTPVDHPRLHAAAARLGGAGDRAVAELAAAYAALPDAEERILALRAGAPSGEARLHLGLGLRLARSEAGREAWTQACTELGWAPEPCATPAEELLDPLAHLDAAVRHGEADLDALVARYPRHRRAILEAMTRCAADAAAAQLDPATGRACLAALARADWGRARALAMSVELPDYTWSTLQTTLGRFDDAEAVHRDLVARGLLPEGTPTGRGLTPVDHLVDGRAGLRLTTFGVDAQGWGVRGIAALAGLGEVPIVVLPALPREGRPAHHEPKLTQLAWIEGTRYRSLARDHGYVDAEQAVGFVNALLEARGDAPRVVIAEGEEGGWVTIVGEPGALQGLVDDGLVIPWIPAPAPFWEAGDTDAVEGVGEPAGEPEVESP